MEPVERDEADKKDASISIEIVVLYFILSWALKHHIPQATQSFRKQIFRYL